MKPKTILTGALLLLSPAALTSCGSDPKFVTTSHVSVGQQFSDLDQAHKDGLITDREYKRLKKALIKRYD